MFLYRFRYSIHPSYQPCPESLQKLTKSVLCNNTKNNNGMVLWNINIRTHPQPDHHHQCLSLSSSCWDLEDGQCNSVPFRISFGQTCWLYLGNRPLLVSLLFNTMRNIIWHCLSDSGTIKTLKVSFQIKSLRVCFGDWSGQETSEGSEEERSKDVDGLHEPRRL